MRKLKEAARLHLELNLGVRPIARACNISTSTASVYVEKLKHLGATYREICDMDEDALLALLFPREEKAPKRPLPDLDYLNRCCLAHYSTRSFSRYCDHCIIT